MLVNSGDVAKSAETKPSPRAGDPHPVPQSGRIGQPLEVAAVEADDRLADAAELVRGGEVGERAGRGVEPGVDPRHPERQTGRVRPSDEDVPVGRLDRLLGSRERRRRQPEELRSEDAEEHGLDVHRPPTQPRIADLPGLPAVPCRPERAVGAGEEGHPARPGRVAAADIHGPPVVILWHGPSGPSHAANPLAYWSDSHQLAA